MEEKINNLIKEYETYAKKKGFKLNPNKEVVRNIVKILLEKEEKLGSRYCPCRRLGEDQEKNKEIICPCVYHLEEIKKDGHCHCLLFFE